jgi:hypothetical protein
MRRDGLLREPSEMGSLIYGDYTPELAARAKSDTLGARDLLCAPSRLDQQVNVAPVTPDKPLQRIGHGARGLRVDVAIDLPLGLKGVTADICELVPLKPACPDPKLPIRHDETKKGVGCSNLK